MEMKNLSSSATDRKTIERNRRNQMKALYSELNSLVSHQNSKESAGSLPDQLDEAANYIKKLQTKLEKMKERKESLMGREKEKNNNTYNNTSSSSTSNTSRTTMQNLRSPQIEIHEMGSALEVILITGLDGQFMFNETIRVLHEEGVEIVNASFSVFDDIIFHTVHSQIDDSSNSCGVAIISERLKKLVQDANNPF